MVGGFAVHAALVLALLILIELLEAIFGIGIILDVVALVLLNVTLVLEGECASWAPEKRMENMISCDAPQYLGAVGSHGEGPHDSNTSQWRNDN